MLKLKLLFACLVVFPLCSKAFTQAPVLLWPGGAPGAPTTLTPEVVRLSPAGEHILSNIQQPSITPYLPPPGSATGVAILVIPGGGHREIWIDHEGYAVASFLRDHGVAAFVLKYRLAREPGSKYTVEGTSLGDTQRALRMIRSRSIEWGIDPKRVGVMGFSAGGELAELASTRYDAGRPTSDDPVERWSSRPAFQALLYPALPLETRLTVETPPAFLACGGKDEPRIAEGLPTLYLALTHLHVSAELHIYAGVGHGFGVRPTNAAPVSGWTELLMEWLNTEGFLKR